MHVHKNLRNALATQQITKTVNENRSSDKLYDKLSILRHITFFLESRNVYLLVTTVGRTSLCN